MSETNGNGHAPTNGYALRLPWLYMGERKGASSWTGPGEFAAEGQGTLNPQAAPDPAGIRPQPAQLINAPPRQPGRPFRGLPGDRAQPLPQTDPLPPPAERGRLRQWLENHPGGPEQGLLLHLFGHKASLAEHHPADLDAIKEHLGTASPQMLLRIMHGLNAEGVFDPARHEMMHELLQRHDEGPEIPLNNRIVQSAWQFPDDGALSDKDRSRLEDSLRRLPRVKGLPSTFILPKGLDAKTVFGPNSGARRLTEEDIYEAQAASPERWFNRPLPTREELVNHQTNWRAMKGANSLNLKMGGKLWTVHMPDGRRYLAKQSASPAEPHVEQAVSGALRLMGLKNVPRVEVRDVPGGKVSLQSFVPGKELYHATDKELARIKKANPPEKLAELLFGEWMLNTDDRHQSNYMFTSDGQLHPVDMGVGLTGGLVNVRWGHHPNALTDGDYVVNRTQKVPRPFMEHVLRQRQAITDHVMKSVDSLPEHDRRNILRQLTLRFNYLARFLEGNRQDGVALWDLPGAEPEIGEAGLGGSMRRRYERQKYQRQIEGPVVGVQHHGGFLRSPEMPHAFPQAWLQHHAVATAAGAWAGNHNHAQALHVPLPSGSKHTAVFFADPHGRVGARWQQFAPNVADDIAERVTAPAMAERVLPLRPGSPTFSEQQHTARSLIDDHLQAAHRQGGLHATVSINNDPHLQAHLRAAILGGPEEAGIFGDYLEDHGRPDLANRIRTGGTIHHHGPDVAGAIAEEVPGEPTPDFHPDSRVDEQYGPRGLHQRQGRPSRYTAGDIGHALPHAPLVRLASGSTHVPSHVATPTALRTYTVDPHSSHNLAMTAGAQAILTGKPAQHVHNAAWPHNLDPNNPRHRQRAESALLGVHAEPSGMFAFQHGQGAPALQHDEVRSHVFPDEDQNYPWSMPETIHPSGTVEIHDHPQLRAFLGAVHDAGHRDKDAMPFQALTDFLADHAHPASEGVARARDFPEVVAALAADPNPPTSDEVLAGTSRGTTNWSTLRDAMDRGYIPTIMGRTPAHQEFIRRLVGLGYTVYGGSGTGTIQPLLRRERFARAGQPQRHDHLHPVAEKVHGAAQDVHPSPSDKQVEAGNWRMGHCRIHGLDISIEVARGGTRRKKNKDGKEWSREMHAHYGRILRTEAADGDHLDCYIGDHPQSELVVVVEQLKQNGRHDEYKIMLGCTSVAEAKKLYLAHYPKGWKFGQVRPMTVPQFKEWAFSEQAKKAWKHGRGMPVRHAAEPPVVETPHTGGYPPHPTIPGHALHPSGMPMREPPSQPTSLGSHPELSGTGRPTPRPEAFETAIRDAPHDQHVWNAYSDHLEDLGHNRYEVGALRAVAAALHAGHPYGDSWLSSVRDAVMSHGALGFVRQLNRLAKHFAGGRSLDPTAPRDYWQQLITNRPYIGHRNVSPGQMRTWRKLHDFLSSVAPPGTRPLSPQEVMSHLLHIGLYHRDRLDGRLDEPPVRHAAGLDNPPEEGDNGGSERPRAASTAGAEESTRGGGQPMSKSTQSPQQTPERYSLGGQPAIGVRHLGHFMHDTAAGREVSHPLTREQLIAHAASAAVSAHLRGEPVSGHAGSAPLHPQGYVGGVPDDYHGDSHSVRMTADPQGRVVASRVYVPHGESDWGHFDEHQGHGSTRKMWENATERESRRRGGSRLHATVHINPSPEFRALLDAAVRRNEGGNEHEVIALADWLNENGREDLADRIAPLDPATHQRVPVNAWEHFRTHGGIPGLLAEEIPVQSGTPRRQPPSTAFAPNPPEPHAAPGTPERYAETGELKGPLVGVDHRGGIYQDHPDSSQARFKHSPAELIHQAASVAAHAFAANVPHASFTHKHPDNPVAAGGYGHGMLMAATPDGRVAAVRSMDFHGSEAGQRIYLPSYLWPKPDWSNPPSGSRTIDKGPNNFSRERSRISDVVVNASNMRRLHANVAIHDDPHFREFLKNAVLGGQAEAGILADYLEERGREREARLIRGMHPQTPEQVQPHAVGPEVAGRIAEEIPGDKTGGQEFPGEDDQ